MPNDIPSVADYIEATKRFYSGGQQQRVAIVEAWSALHNDPAASDDLKADIEDRRRQACQYDAEDFRKWAADCPRKKLYESLTAEQCARLWCTMDRNKDVAAQTRRQEGSNWADQRYFTGDDPHIGGPYTSEDWGA